MSRRHRLLLVALLAASIYPSPHAALAAPHAVMLFKYAEEPVVAVNPRHHSSVVVASIGGPVVGKSNPIGIYSSHDRGRTFTARPTPLPLPYTYAADPSIGFATNGTVFASYLVESPTYCNGPVGSGGIIVAASRNGGKTFRPPTVVDVNSGDDKPYMAVESVPGHLSHIFVAWTRSANQQQIFLSRSTDGGVSFSPPQMLAESPVTQSGAFPVVGPKGRVYVFWAGLNEPGNNTLTGKGQIFLSTSSNDGASFGPARSIAGPFTSVPRMVDPERLRTITYPSAAVARDGRLYLTWTAVSRELANSTVSSDIMLSSSADFGKSWTKPMPVNDVQTGDRFLPSVTALSDGSVGLAFYDQRNSSEQLDVYAARARFKGGFHVSRNVQVNDVPARVTDIYEAKPSQSACYSPGRFFGDYLGLAAGQGHRMFVTWGAAQLHVYGQIEVWVASVALPGKYR